MAVTLKEDGNTEKKVLGSLTEAIKAQSYSQKEWERLKEIFADPGLQMVSFTITEKRLCVGRILKESFSLLSGKTLIMDQKKQHQQWQ